MLKGFCAAIEKQEPDEYRLTYHLSLRALLRGLTSSAIGSALDLFVARAGVSHGPSRRTIMVAGALSPVVPLPFHNERHS